MIMPLTIPLVQLFKILDDEFRANQSSVKNEVVFRHRQHCCEFCGKLIRSSSEMLRHIRTHRPDADRLVRKCHQCLRLFADESSFEVHRRLHEEPLHCTICQRPFVERVKLQQHVMKNHVRMELLSCIPCKESFLSEAELETHMNRHLDNYREAWCGRRDQGKKRVCMWSMWEKIQWIGRFTKAHAKSQARTTILLHNMWKEVLTSGASPAAWTNPHWGETIPMQNLWLQQLPTEWTEESHEATLSW